MAIPERLFEPDVEVRSGLISSSAGELTEREASVMAHAAESRRREFATGRRLARQALTALGLDGGGPGPLDLLPDPDRVPIWPRGSVGTITHKRDRCLVAVGRAETYRGLGLDLEPAQPVRPELQRTICTERERAWLRNCSREEQGLRCRIVFSVKEAVYKAFYPSLREFWSFQDVAVEIDLARSRFVADVPPSTGVHRVEGRVIQRAGWIVAGIALAQDVGDSPIR